MIFYDGYPTNFIKICGVIYAPSCHSCCILYYVAILAEKETLFRFVRQNSAVIIGNCYNSHCVTSVMENFINLLLAYTLIIFCSVYSSSRSGINIALFLTLYCSTYYWMLNWFLRLNVKLEDIHIILLLLYDSRTSNPGWKQTIM